MMQLHVIETAEELKLSKVDNEPWGFRVTGGLDFGTPLTIIKVQARSPAEQAGLKVGDMLLSANGQTLSLLTHQESYKYLQECGNFIQLSVVRGSLVLPPDLAPPVVLNECERTEDNAADDEVKNLQPLAPREPSLFETIFGPLDEPPTERCKSAFEELVEELTQKQRQGQDIPSDYQVEQEIVTKDVSETVEHVAEFQPLTDSATSEHAVKTAATTTAAAVVSAVVAAASAVENAVVALAATDTLETTSTPQVSLEEKSKQIQDKNILNKEVQKEVSEEEFQEIMLGHAEVLKGTAIGVNFEKMILPNTEVIEQSKVLQALKEDKTGPETKKLSTFLIPPDRPKIKPKEKSKKVKPQANAETITCQGVLQLVENELSGKHVEREMEPDDKLAALQNQLAALLQLPAVIQQQLSVLQQEISNIVQQKLEESTEEESKEPNEEECEVQAQEESQKIETERDENANYDKEAEGEKESNVQKEQTDTDTTTNATNDPESHVQENEATESNQETQQEKRKRDIKWQHEKPEKNKPFYPLTPLPRDMVLPGRKMFQVHPEETYDEEFIAETLSGNAEVIMGTTIGINFLKFTPNRSYEHLKTSSVYRMIHESDNKGEGGIMSRQEKLIAAEDYITNEDPGNDV